MNSSRFTYDKNGNGNSWDDSRTYMKTTSTNINQDLFEPKKLVSLVQRHVWVIIIFATVAVSGTYYIINNYALPVYQSNGTLIITNNESSLPGAGDGGGNTGGGVGNIISRSFTSNYGNPVQNAIYLFQTSDLSEEVARRLITSFDSSNHRKYPTLWLNYPEDSTIVTPERLASRIRSGLSVEPVEPKSKLLNIPNPNLLEVTYQSYSPYEAAKVVNYSLEIFQEISLEQKQNAASKALAFLQEKREEARKQLNEAEDRLVSFKNENQLVAIDAQANNSVNSLSQLQAEKQNIEIQLESVNSSIQTYESQMEAIKPGLKDQYTKAIGPTIQNYQENLAELRTRRFVILSNNPQLKENPNSEPELRRLNQQISDLENEIQALSEGLVSDQQGYLDTGDGNLAQELANIRQNLIQLRLEKNQYESQIKVIDNRIQEAKSFLDTYPNKQVTLARLESEVQRHKQLLNNIINQESEVALWQQTQKSSGTIMDHANPIFSPVKPNKILWLGFAAMMGLVLPVGMVIVKNLFSSVIRSVEQLRAFSHPLLSVVYDHSLIKSDGWLASRNDKPKSASISKSIVFYHNIDTPVAESYRKIVSQVLYKDPDSVPQSLLITSSGKGEGKTTLTGNLGAAFAELDKKVLIIDCDFRRPASHKLFSLDNSVGIKEVLFGGAKLSDAIKETEIKDLSVLTSGGKPESPAKLLASEKFKEMIKVVKPNYDIIIFDTPPQGLVSDVASLLEFSDLVIVTAKFGETSINVLSHTLQEIDKNQRININLVLTSYKPKNSYDSYDTKGLHKYMYQQYYEYEKVESAK